MARMPKSLSISSLRKMVVLLFRFRWKWRRRSPSKVKERTHEEATEALFAGREGRHPEAASAGERADLEAV
jgi:hypothetical protein